jgi:hypothetical protein
MRICRNQRKRADFTSEPKYVLLAGYSSKREAVYIHAVVTSPQQSTCSQVTYKAYEISVLYVMLYYEMCTQDMYFSEFLFDLREHIKEERRRILTYKPQYLPTCLPWFFTRHGGAEESIYLALCIRNVDAGLAYAAICLISWYDMESSMEHRYN